MKKICTALVAVIAFVLVACTGDSGPPGPQGPQGIDGGIIVSKAFEIEIDFNASNNYEFFEPYGFEVLPTDVTLVYIRWEVIDGQEIWRLLPQNVFFDEGVLTYNFDFTQDDVRFFLDGTIDFGLLDPSFTQDQVFRVVVIPADNVGRMDYSNLSVVMDAYGITSFDKRY